MSLSSDESRALAFVLALVALAGVARFVTQPAPASLPTAAEMDAGALEGESQAALERQQALARPLAAGERVDVNGAGAGELDRLPGVGPALAERIVAERERAGAFDSAADLRAVPGLGAALLARLAPRLAFGPGAGLPRRVAASPSQTDVVARADRADDPVGRAGRGSGRGASRGAAAAPVARSPTPAVSPAAGERLDVNRATAAELEALPGIGPALAARIVAQRDSLHGFRAVDDLLRVRGIGPATLRRLKPYLRS